MKKWMAGLLALMLSASVPGAVPAESASIPVPRFKPQADIAARVSWTVYDSSGPVEDYHRGPKELIVMPAGDEYTKQRIGVLTFRSNAFRQNAAAGSLASAPSLRVLWETAGGSPEWTGQPVIIKWSSEIRAASDLYEEKKNKTALKEVVVPGAEGSLLLLDLEDGQASRDPIPAGAPLTGTPCASPAGLPYLGFAVTGKEPVYRQYNLYRAEALDAGVSPDLYDNRFTGLVLAAAGNLARAFSRSPAPEAVLLTSPLIDRISDTLITAGEDGLLYLVNFGTYFDYRDAEYRISPSVTAVKAVAAGEDEAQAAVRAPVAAYDRFVFYADMGGYLRCVDTNTLSPVWMAETGDSVLAAVALDLREENLWLYTANILNLRESGAAQVRRFSATDGREAWRLDIGVDKSGNETCSGFAASPVIGTGPLDSMVYFTVTGLNEEGRKTLGLSEEAESALIALDKAEGAVRWVRPFPDACVSSPVGIYDQEGNGWIIQCTRGGTVVLLEGLTGAETASLSLGGEILSSPAVYNGYMVVCAAGTVYGIGLQPET